MSESDGYVGRTKKIVDHGPDVLRWNLVIVGDGYRESELDKYHDDVQNFLTTLRATAPFDELYCGINVHCVDVVSTDSGAADPGCGSGPVTTVNTYFDAHFCTLYDGNPIERLLRVNTDLALLVAAERVPEKDLVLCIVNAGKYGGSGGAIATCSASVQAANIAIHEIGHTAFKLGDEYPGVSPTPPVEPSFPNVTLDTNRATNKWNALILPTTPMPSGCSLTCAASNCVPPDERPALDAVGAYEGALNSDCNVYSPLPFCKMKLDVSAVFCPVCAGVIRHTLLPYLPAESVNLVTQSIAFTNVPAGMGGVGVTTHRAIVWEVVTCRRLTFEIIAGPTGGFETPFGTTIQVTTDPISAQTSAQLSLSYTSTNPGDSANGSVTVRCNETGQTWMINIVADTIARPRSAVVLVLDRSGSMNDDAGDATTKVAKLREAANAFISIMQPDDGIGVVRFNHLAQRLMEVQDAGVASGGAGRTTALAHISGSDMAPSGGTSIGDGVVKGKQMLDDAQAAAVTPYVVTAMVVLTDGMWNVPPDLATVGGSITANTYAVGFGLPSNISVPALTTLCQGHNGFMLITGLISTDQSLRLAKYFVQILAGVTNAQIIVDPRGVLDVVAEHRIPFWICEADYGMDLIVLSPFPQVIDFQLETPVGTRIVQSWGPGGANSQFVLSTYASYYRCALPVLPADASGSHEGLWYAVLKLAFDDDQQTGFIPPPGGVPYEFVAQTYSSLTLSAGVAQASFEVGADVRVYATLREYESPLLGRAQVWAEIGRPDGVTEHVVLEASSGGQFVATYTGALPGVFTIRLRARGETMRGMPFERERTLTAVGVPGGDQWSPDNAQTSGCCDCLRCLVGRPYRLGLALLFAFLIWLVGFAWGAVVFMTPFLGNAAPPIPYVSANPVISFPLLILWLLLAYLFAKSYLKDATNKAVEGLKLGLVFVGVNLVLDLVVIVIALGTGLGFFSSLSVWLAYFILLIVPWLTGCSLQRAATQ